LPSAIDPGRFELRTLPPVRISFERISSVSSRHAVRLSRYVRADARRRRLLYGTRTPCARASPLLAGVGGGEEGEPVDGAVDDPSVVSPTDDHSELAWRLRHIRRGILKDAEWISSRPAATIPTCSDRRRC
jgi:hypothetical protein